MLQRHHIIPQCRHLPDSQIIDRRPHITRDLIKMLPIPLDANDPPIDLHLRNIPQMAQVQRGSSPATSPFLPSCPRYSMVPANPCHSACASKAFSSSMVTVRTVPST